MAIATGTMTITITESLDVGTTVMDTATSIAKEVTVNDIYKRVITVSTNEVTLYDTHDSNVGGSTFDDDLISYVRISNYDGDSDVVLRLKNADNDEFAYKLGAGQSFLLWGHEGTMNAVAAGTLDIGTGWHDLSSVKATSTNSTCDLEVLIAS